jgi:hypothetical protein
MGSSEVRWFAMSVQAFENMRKSAYAAALMGWSDN